MNQLKVGIFLSYISLFLNNVIGLLYTPFMIRSLGQSEYGLYSLAASVIGYLTIMDMGFGNAITRYTAKYKALGDRQTEAKLHGMFIILYLFIGLLVAAVGIILCFNIESLFGRAMSSEELYKMKVIMGLLTFNLTVTFAFSIYGAIIIAYEKFIFFKIINIVRIVLLPCFMIPLLLLGYKSITMVVVITGLNIVCLISNFIYCKKKIKITPQFRKIDIPLLKEISGYSIFIFIGVIVDQIYWNTGQIILGAVSGTIAVATFAVAMQIKTLYFGMSLAISNVFLPKITSMITSNASTSEVSNLFVRIGRLQYIILSFILSGFILFGRKFVLLWVGEAYIESFFIALIILIPVTIPLIQNLGITILQAQNRQKFRALSYFIIAIFNILLSIPFAKQMGGIGCAIVIAISLLLGNVLIINIYYKKKIKIDIYRFWKEIGQMTIPVILALLVFIAIDLLLIKDDSTIWYIIRIFLYVGIFIPLMWKMGMNDYEKSIIKEPLLIYRKKIKKRERI